MNGINNKARGHKRYITLGFRWLCKRSTHIKFGVTGQDSSPQSPTISYRRPLAVTLMTDTTKQTRQK